MSIPEFTNKPPDGAAAAKRGSRTPEKTAWRRFTSQSHGLTFHFPTGWRLVREGSYVFLSENSPGSGAGPEGAGQPQMVIDLAPIHLYPCRDLSEYLDRTTGPTASLDRLKPGYQGASLTCPGTPGHEFTLFYVGRGNLAYTITASGAGEPGTAEAVAQSMRFR